MVLRIYHGKVTTVMGGNMGGQDGLNGPLALNASLIGTDGLTSDGGILYVGIIGKSVHRPLHGN